MNRKLSDISSMMKLGQKAFALGLPLIEEKIVFQSLKNLLSQSDLYYWNIGYDSIHSVDSEGNFQVRFEHVHDVILWLQKNDTPGFYILSGVLSYQNDREAAGLGPDHQHIIRLYNLLTKIQSKKQFLLFLEQNLEVPSSIHQFIQQLSLDKSSDVSDFFQELMEKKRVTPEERQRVLNLSRSIRPGELQLIIPLLSSNNDQPLSQQIINYKKSIFQAQGIEFIGEPDVEKAVGLELLDQYLDKCACLLRTEAYNHGLQFPRGILLWGPPGTGKSLCAKLAATKMGVPLIAADWAGLRGSNASESRANINRFLADCDTLGEEGLVLYFDDFDKGFAGHDSDSDGGTSRQMASKLLTWMQEHTSQVLVMATINNLGFLPPELIRRFEENIFFVDIPHAGARYEIFKIHLNKYFSEYQFTDSQWRRLLNETHLLTPAEISNVVKRTATEAFYHNCSKGLPDAPLTVTIDDLLEQRYLMTPSLERDEDKIIEIRNKAHFARPANGEDQSRFAQKAPSLFGIDTIAS